MSYLFLKFKGPLDVKSGYINTQEIMILQQEFINDFLHSDI